MKKYLFITTWVLLMACSGEKKAEVGVQAQDMANAVPPPSSMSEKPLEKKEDTPPQPTNQPKKVIYTADVKYQVYDLPKSEKSLKDLVATMGGYVTASSQNRQFGTLETRLTIRVPVAKFDAFLSSTEKESVYTDYKNVSSEDVSEEYYDNELRLKSKQEAFDQYLQLLKQAKNVTEVLAVEEQIRVIREEIESKKGRQKFIDNQVAYSTVTLNLYQVIASDNAPDLPFYIKIWEKFTDGIRAFFEFGIGLFYWIPFIGLAWLLYWGFKRWRRRQ